MLMVFNTIQELNSPQCTDWSARINRFPIFRTEVSSKNFQYNKKKNKFGFVMEKFLFIMGWWILNYFVEYDFLCKCMNT